MKHRILVLILLSSIACNQAPKPENTSPAAIDSTLGVATWSGPEIDLLKKATEAYAKADWATWRSCFADSARASHNVDPLDPGLSIPIDSILARHKYSRETLWDGMDIGTPIYEIVSNAKGEVYGHLWVLLKTKSRKTGQQISVPVFASYGIKNGKLQYEAAVYDNSLVMGK